jgi:hypothetical protein
MRINAVARNRLHDPPNETACRCAQPSHKLFVVVVPHLHKFGHFY